MKELNFEELSIRQKLGMTFTASLHGPYVTPEDEAFVLDLIRNHSLGAVWIQKGYENTSEQIAKVKEVADYPILIITDAESGINEYTIGKHSAVGCTGSQKHAYAFGKAVGVTARKMGYNVVCDPVLDMGSGARSLGTDKNKVAELAIGIAQGMHDGGVLTVGKHYPSGSSAKAVDSHMAEGISENTTEELLNYNLYPYMRLNEKGLLDGVMVHHKRYINIDPNHPASLSKPVIDVFRAQGYEGFVITDALCMMGIRAKYDDVTSKGLAASAGVDLLLPYTADNKDQFDQYCKAYEQGLVDTDMLDAAVKRVLATHHKVMLLPKDTELTEEDIYTFKHISKDGVYTRLDEGLSQTISRDGKHYFVVMVDQNVDSQKVEVDTFSGGWHQPGRILKKIEELFPNSHIQVIHQFPSQGEMWTVINKSIGYDELVFITFSEQLAYTGREHLTIRVVSLFESMQRTNRISTVIHLGNPRVLEVLPHIPRYIFGGHSAESVETCLEVLAGTYPANGVPTFKFELK